MVIIVLFISRLILPDDDFLILVILYKHNNIPSQALINLFLSYKQTVCLFIYVLFHWKHSIQI
jgi:hypothetical protein